MQATNHWNEQLAQTNIDFEYIEKEQEEPKRF